MPRELHPLGDGAPVDAAGGDNGPNGACGGVAAGEGEGKGKLAAQLSLVGRDVQKECSSWLWLLLAGGCAAQLTMLCVVRYLPHSPPVFC